MSRYLRYFFTVIALLCVAIVIDHVFHLGIGTSRLLDPQVQKNPMKLIEPVVTPQPMDNPQIPRSIATPVTTVEPGSAPLPKRYVKIEGQLFEYNPSNVYKVRGIPTFYISGGKGAENDARAGADMAHRAAAEALGPAVKPASAPGPANAGAKAAKLADMVHKNPMGVYTPIGLQDTVDGARDAVNQLNNRNQVLKELDTLDK